MSSSTVASASNVAGQWLGDLASTLQGTWRSAAAHGERQKKLGSGDLAEENEMEAAAAPSPVAAGSKAAATEGGDVGRCGGAMSDTTVYLLLDRFAPN